VSKVVADTPAERAGMKSGDVITRVGDRDVEDSDALRRALQDKSGRVSITVMRKGVRRTVDAELESDSDARRDVIKLRRGDSPTVLRIPEIRSRVLRDLNDNDAQRGDLEKQLRELRQELRELRQKLEAMDKN
jgi:C-terminal processing protease CtpA/Prc